MDGDHFTPRADPTGGTFDRVGIVLALLVLAVVMRLAASSPHEPPVRVTATPLCDQDGFRESRVCQP